MSGVVLGASPGEKQKAALEPVGVRHRSGEHAARSQDADRLGDNGLGVAQVLEELAGDDGVEACVGEGKLLLRIRDHGLDPESRSAPQGGAVDIEADDRVAGKEVPADRTRAAAEIEDAMPRPADRGDEEWDALGDEDEVAAVTRGAVMLFVSSAQVFHELTPPSA